MVLRIGKVLVGVAAWLVAISTILAAALAWRLAAGPIPLDLARPHIEAALRASDGRYEVSIGATALAWDGWRRPIEVVASDVHLLTPEGDTLAVLPRVDLGLSAKALFSQRMLAPTDIEVADALLLLERDADGRIGLRLPAGGDAPRADPLGALIERLLAPPDHREPIGHLEALRVRQGRLSVVDRATGLELDLPRVDLHLARDAGGVAGRLEVELAQEGGQARLLLRGRYSRSLARAELTLELDHLLPTTLAAWSGHEVEGKLDLPIDGRLRFAVDELGRPSPIDFELSAGGGTIVLPRWLARPLPLDLARASGRLDIEAATLRLDEAVVATGPASVGGGATLSWPDEGLGLLAEASVKDLAVADLDLYWPATLAPRARAWVVANVTGGHVDEGVVRIHLAPGAAAEGLVPEDAVEGSFRFREVAIHYLRPLPPVVEGRGQARFSARRLAFGVEAAESLGLAIEQGQVTIDGIGLPGEEELRVEASASGPLADGLAILDHPPLGLPGRIGLDPSRTTGAARGRLTIELPLKRELGLGDVGLAAEVTVADGAVADLLPGIDLEGGALDLSVAKDGMDVAGHGRFAGVPLAIAWREDFAGETRRSYRLTGMVDVADAERLGLRPGAAAGGRVGLEARGVEPRAGPRRLELMLDLADAGLDLGPLAWAKPAGAPGWLSLGLRGPDAGEMAIERFDLQAPGLDASGSGRVALAPARLLDLELDHLRLQGSDLRGRLAAVADGWHLELAGPMLDLRPWLAKSGAEDGGHDLDGREPLPPLRLRFALEQVRVAEAEALLKVSGDLQQGGDGWRTGKIEGGLTGGGRFDLDLRPEGGASELQLTSDDAGALLRALGHRGVVEGGELRLRAAVARQRPRLAAQGHLALRDYSVLRAPVLARLLSLASLTGIGQALEGRGIWFERLDVPFRLDDGLLAIERARSVGSQVGLTLGGSVAIDTGALALDGTIVPAYGLNRALGRIPVVGWLLRGSEGEGAFAADFAIRGTTEEPQVSVNPLSVLAPGFLRDLFAAGSSDDNGDPWSVRPDADR